MGRFTSNEPSKAESCCWCCAHCCVLYSALGVILMAFFGWLVSSRAVAFQIYSAQAYSDSREPWDFDQRANICFGAAALYGLTGCIALASRNQIAAARAARGPASN
eukprot:Hpha_TRINITY_DN2783_c0_g1::TRINITY_DN2783_c0_g1_i1::g.110420::m.110420